MGEGVWGLSRITAAQLCPFLLINLPPIAHQLPSGKWVNG